MLVLVVDIGHLGELLAGLNPLTETVFVNFKSKQKSNQNANVTNEVHCTKLNDI